jgi:2-C-methyl-D-erythritol 4-phosphate cytidylyltransferase
LNTSVLVIIPAAGSGSRFGGEIPKQFRALAGTPILLRVIERFFNDERVVHVVVAVAEPLLANIKQTDRVRFVAGGATRQESVMCALEAAEGEFDLVAVHDAVRPFFKTATFHALLDAATEHGGAFPAVPVTDTIHIVRGGRLVSTPEREQLVAAQTPQCFRLAILHDVLEKAKRDGVDGTDEASLAARYGYEVRAVPGDAVNFKITRAEDLEYAESHFEELSAP